MMRIQLQEQGYWYKNFLYRVERERGLDFQEDLFNPFVLSWNLSKERSAMVIASTEQWHIGQAAAICTAELQRRQRLVASSPVDDPLVCSLTLRPTSSLRAGRRLYRHCRLSLVHGLGPRHHDFAARANAVHWQN